VPSARCCGRLFARRTWMANLVSLCRRHHRAVHEEGWRIHMADGIPVVEEPPP
jgi:hypothetical protein